MSGILISPCLLPTPARPRRRPPRPCGRSASCPRAGDEGVLALASTSAFGAAVFLDFCIYSHAAAGRNHCCTAPSATAPSCMSPAKPGTTCASPTTPTALGRTCSSSRVTTAGAPWWTSAMESRPCVRWSASSTFPHAVSRGSVAGPASSGSTRKGGGRRPGQGGRGRAGIRGQEKGCCGSFRGNCGRPAVRSCFVVELDKVVG